MAPRMLHGSTAGNGSKIRTHQYHVPSVRVAYMMSCWETLRMESEACVLTLKRWYSCTLSFTRATSKLSFVKYLTVS